MDPIKGKRRRELSLNNATYKAWRIGKNIYHAGRYVKIRDKKILLIVGCHRSGTTLLSNLFEHDIQTKSYGEVSKLTSEDPIRQLRLNDWASVRDTLIQDKSPLVVLKPLVESQNLSKLLDFLPNSSAVWLYRDYRDVASSAIVAWGRANAIRDLSHIVKNTPNNWRTEFVSDEIRSVVTTLFSEDMPSHDAAALFWYVRNQIFFDRNLASLNNVMTCHYSEFVLDPTSVMRKIYQFVDVDYPGDWIAFRVHGNSVKKGRKIKISPEIEDLCQALLAKLNHVHYGTNELEFADIRDVTH